MAIRSPSTALTTEKKARKARTSAAKHYLATVYGNDSPVVVIANTQDAALKVLVIIRPATFADMKQAGRDNYTEINATPGQTDAAPSAPIAFGSAADSKTA